MSRFEKYGNRIFSILLFAAFLFTSYGQIIPTPHLVRGEISCNLDLTVPQLDEMIPRMASFITESCQEATPGSTIQYSMCDSGGNFTFGFSQKGVDLGTNAFAVVLNLGISSDSYEFHKEFVAIVPDKINYIHFNLSGNEECFWPPVCTADPHHEECTEYLLCLEKGRVFPAYIETRPGYPDAFIHIDLSSISNLTGVSAKLDAYFSDEFICHPILPSNQTYNDVISANHVGNEIYDKCLNSSMSDPTLGSSDIVEGWLPPRMTRTFYLSPSFDLSMTPFVYFILIKEFEPKDLLPYFFMPFEETEVYLPDPGRNTTFLSFNVKLTPFNASSHVEVRVSNLTVLPIQPLTIYIFASLCNVPTYLPAFGEDIIPTPPPTIPPSNPPALSPGAIAGIVIGSVAFVILLAIGIRVAVIRFMTSRPSNARARRARSKTVKTILTEI
jgi:hypothetical protein